MTAVEFCDERERGFGWIHPEPGWMARTGHAVLADGGVWIIDPIDGDGVDERIRALGEPAGVVRLLDRHPRDCEAFASRYDVPLHAEPFDGVPGAPFEVVPVVRRRVWREVALWFGDERTLACADALANAPGYSAPGENVGVHPMLRLKPPRRLMTYPVEHLLLGHGPGVHGDAAQQVIATACDRALRDLPSFVASQLRRIVRR